MNTVQTLYMINFQATAFHYPPRTIVTKDESGNEAITGGYEFLIFDAIARKLKFVYRKYH